MVCVLFLLLLSLLLVCFFFVIVGHVVVITIVFVLALVRYRTCSSCFCYASLAYICIRHAFDMLVAHLGPSLS